MGEDPFDDGGVIDRGNQLHSPGAATAYGVHPERFPGGLPQPPARPTEVWINPPTPRATEAALLH
jgi:hypothetical protein